MDKFLVRIAERWMKINRLTRFIFALIISFALGTIFFGWTGFYLDGYFSSKGHPVVFWSIFGMVFFSVIFFFLDLDLKKSQELKEKNQELAEKNQELKELALTDLTTGLRNSRFIEEEAPMIVGRAKREKKILCVLYCDIDSFKKINDTHGHSIGDAVLKRFAKELRAIFSRTDDLISRKGNRSDEFTVYWLSTKLEATETFIRKIRSNLREIEVKGVKFSVSAGFACLDYTHFQDHYFYENPETLSKILFDLEKLADQNLYKEKGNNKKAGGQ